MQKWAIYYDAPVNDHVSLKRCFNDILTRFLGSLAWPGVILLFVCFSINNVYVKNQYFVSLLFDAIDYMK